MTLHLKMPSKVNNLSPQICVIGVGGAGKYNQQYD